MCSYSGGKQKIGKRLSSIILSKNSELNPTGSQPINYCEPFCGMLGVYQHLSEHFKGVKLAGDVNESVIEMWKSAQKGWIPPTFVSEDEFNELKREKGESALKGYVGHQYSFGGQYFEAYAPKYGKTTDSSIASGKVRNIATGCCNDVIFTPAPYTQFSNLKGFVIYCDPPYQGTHYKHCTFDFDYNAFWDWCRKMSKENMVFVSNYTAPEDFEEIFSLDRKITGYGTHVKDRKRVEKLFLIMTNDKCVTKEESHELEKKFLNL